MGISKKNKVKVCNNLSKDDIGSIDHEDVIALSAARRGVSLGQKKKEILQNITELFGKMSQDDILKVYAFMLTLDLKSIPAQAPELYVDRSNRKESAPDFLRRVYKDYLGKGLTRPDIRQLDPKLYAGLYSWMKRNDTDLPTDIDLPTKSETIDEKLGKLRTVYGKQLSIDHLEDVSKGVSNLRQTIYDRTFR